jgi:hypothetical protein
MLSKGGITRKIDWSHQKDIGSGKTRSSTYLPLREVLGRWVDVGVKLAFIGSNRVESP